MRAGLRHHAALQPWRGSHFCESLVVSDDCFSPWLASIADKSYATLLASSLHSLFGQVRLSTAWTLESCKKVALSTLRFLSSALFLSLRSFWSISVFRAPCLTSIGLWQVHSFLGPFLCQSRLHPPAVQLPSFATWATRVRFRPPWPALCLWGPVTASVTSRSHARLYHVPGSQLWRTNRWVEYEAQWFTIHTLGSHWHASAVSAR